MITVESCELDELVIDDGIVSSSFVVRFGLLCDDFYIRGIFSALIMVGMLLGSYPAGYISGQILQLHLSIRFLSRAKLCAQKFYTFVTILKLFASVDYFGRKKALGAWIFVLWTCGIINAFTVHRGVYIICRLDLN